MMRLFNLRKQKFENKRVRPFGEFDWRSVVCVWQIIRVGNLIGRAWFPFRESYALVKNPPIICEHMHFTHVHFH